MRKEVFLKFFSKIYEDSPYFIESFLECFKNILIERLFLPNNEHEQIEYLESLYGANNKLNVYSEILYFTPFMGTITADKYYGVLTEIRVNESTKKYFYRFFPEPIKSLNFEIIEFSDRLDCERMALIDLLRILSTIKYEN